SASPLHEPCRGRRITFESSCSLNAGSKSVISCRKPEGSRLSLIDVIATMESNVTTVCHPTMPCHTVRYSNPHPRHQMVFRYGDANIRIDSLLTRRYHFGT